MAIENNSTHLARENLVYTPNYRPFVRDITTYCSSGEPVEGVGAQALTNTFQELGGAWRRFAVRHIMGYAAVDYDLVIEEYEPGLIRATRIPNPLPQSRANSLFGNLADAGLVPQTSAYDKLHMMGQWNRWQLTSLVRDGQMLPLARHIFADGAVDQDLLHAEDEDDVYRLFVFPKDPQNEPPELVKVYEKSKTLPASKGGEKGMMRLLIEQNRERFAAIMGDSRVRAQIGTQNPYVHSVSRQYQSLLLPFRGPILTHWPAERDELVQMIEDGEVTIHQIAVEFGELESNLRKVFPSRTKQRNSTTTPDVRGANHQESAQMVQRLREIGQEVTIRARPIMMNSIVDNAYSIARTLHEKGLLFESNAVTLEHPAELEDSFFVSLGRLVTLQHRVNECVTDAQARLDLNEANITSLVLGLATEYNVMSASCLRHGIADKTREHMLRHLHRLSPNVLDECMQTYPLLPSGFIATMIQKMSLGEVFTFLQSHHERAQVYRLNPTYGRLTNSQITYALYGRTNEEAERIMARFKDPPKREQRARAHRAGVAGKGATGGRNTSIEQERTPAGADQTNRGELPLAPGSTNYLEFTQKTSIEPVYYIASELLTELVGNGELVAQWLAEIERKDQSLLIQLRLELQSGKSLDETLRDIVPSYPRAHTTLRRLGKNYLASINPQTMT